MFGYNKQVGFGFWQVDANDNTGSVIASFEKGDEKRDLRIVSSATVRAGTIFCREEWGTGTRSLWRLSKNGTLKRITEECSSDMVISGTTAYFFKNRNELWSSDGSEANTALVMAIADTEADTDIGRIIRGTCLVDGILYTTRRSKVWRFDIKNNVASFPQTSGSFFCLSNGFIMSVGSPDDDDYEPRRSRSMFNVKTNEFHPVYGTGRNHYVESGPKALGVGPSGSIFKFGNDYYILAVWFRSAENYEDERSGTMIIKYVFKDSNYPVYLTPVLELLKD